MACVLCAVSVEKNGQPAPSVVQKQYKCHLRNCAASCKQLPRWKCVPITNMLSAQKCFVDYAQLKHMQPQKHCILLGLWQRPFTRKKPFVKTRSSCYHEKYCKKKNMETCQAEPRDSVMGFATARVHPFNQ